MDDQPEIEDLISPINLAVKSSKGRFLRAPHLSLLEYEVLETLQPDGWDILIAQAPPRHGKRLEHDTLVLTPKGWSTHGELEVGDEVFAVDGTRTQVLAVSEDGACDCLVKLSDGEQILAHEDHLWTVFDRNAKDCRVVTTKQIEACVYAGYCRSGKPRGRYLLDYCKPLEMPPAYGLPVHPYFLGVWLGDGKATGWSICGEVNDLAHIELKLLKLGYKPSWETIHSATGVRYLGFKGLPWLAKLGLLNHKHIPMEYKLASVGQRRELLRGIVDTDGHVEPGGRVRFVSCSLRLAEDVAEIVRSLGYRASTTVQQPTTSSSGIVGRQEVFTVQWTPHDGEQQATLPRKDIRRKGVRRRRSIVSVERVAAKPGKCIEVSHPQKQYLVGKSLTPTHNSEFLSKAVPTWFHLTYPERQSMLISYGLDLARRHSRHVRNEVIQYAPWFGHKGVDPNASSASDWQMANNYGGMKAAGIGGGITGRGADLMAIDDYIKNAVEAVSDDLRERQWEWFQTTAYSRIEPGGKLIVLATRWHSDDLIGRLLKFALEDTKLKVREIRLPALAEPTPASPDPLGRQTDEPLWPERISYEYLDGRRRILDPYWWNAIYQQRLGTYGHNEWPSEYFYGILAQDDEWPRRMALSATALDPSKGKNARKGDYSAIVNVGFSGGYLWVEADIERRPVPKMMLDLVAFNDRIRPTVTGIEGVAFQELLATDYEQAQVESGYYRDPPELIDNTVNKELRIGRLGTWLRLHRVKIKRNASGLLLLEQLKAFPNGKHDDGPDAMEMAIRLLLMICEDLSDMAPPEIRQLSI